MIRLARTPRLRDTVCVRTPAFVRAAAAFSRPALPAEVRAALAEPYRRPELRRAVGDFVADIPLEPQHPSRTTLDGIAAGATGLVDLPALVLWGARDPVFTEPHLADLEQRLPRADVQRYAAAAHLVTEDVPGNGRARLALDHCAAAHRRPGSSTLHHRPTACHGTAVPAR